MAGELSWTSSGLEIDAPLADETAQDAAGLTPDRAAQERLLFEVPKHARHPEALTSGMDVDVVVAILTARLDGHGESEVRSEDGDGVVLVSHAGSALSRALGPDPVEAPFAQAPHVVPAVLFQDACGPRRGVFVVVHVD